MKSLLLSLGIMGMIPLLAVAQSPTPSRSIIKPVGFGIFSHHGGCSTCAAPAPTCTSCAPSCSTPMPSPGPCNCCPRPCLLEKLRRGLRSLDCLLPCRLGCKPACGSSCGGCTATCESRTTCTSCCPKSRAHFFACRKPSCCSPCGDMGCSTGMPMEMMSPPTPMPDNPFKDDNMPPPGRDTYYKPYWKKNNAGPAMPAPRAAVLDPYASTEPIHIKAKPVHVAAKPVRVAAKPVTKPEYSEVSVAAAEEVAPVSLSIHDDEPPAPPRLLNISSNTASPVRYDSSIPANPLRR